MGHREDLLRAAHTLLRRNGYARITARDLVAESGTNLASIGYHFGSKEGLLNTALTEVLEQWNTELIRSVMAGQAGPWQRVVHTFSEVLRGVAERRPLLVAYVEALAQAERSAQLRSQLCAQLQRCRDRVAELVAEELGGELAARDPHCRAIASFVLAACDGLAMQYLLDPHELPDADTLSAALNALGTLITAAR
ncbi:MAG: TetR/AcrR family transcriptional regulator [Sciscionella sp.]